MKLKDKKGFIDPEILFTPAFIILFGLGAIATVLGYFMGKQMGFASFPLWQLGIILLVIFGAAYFFAAKDG